MTYNVWLWLRVHLTFHAHFSLLLEEELDVHATYGFFDHVERLVLRIQSLLPHFFHFLPFVLRIDSEYLEILASSQLRNLLKILSQPDWRHLLPVFGVLGLRFWIADLDWTTHNERVFPLLQVRCVQHLQKFCFWCLTPHIPFPKKCFHILLVHTVRVHWVPTWFVIVTVSSKSSEGIGSAGSELLIIVHERFSPRWIGVAWPLLISIFIRFIEFCTWAS